MYIYILVAPNSDGELTTDMPRTLGRAIRAYKSQKVATRMAKKFNCHVVEIDVTRGELVYQS